MLRVVLVAAAVGVGAAATLAGITLAPVLGVSAALVALVVGLTGGAILAALCWRSCHLSPTPPEAA